MSPLYSNPALPPDSTILITGINGWVASHIAEEALAAGLKVRGTYRTLSKASWMDPLFTTRFGPGRFSLVHVPDMSTPGAFDSAVQGCAGVVHCASDMGMGANPNDVIPGVVDGVLHALRAAAAAPEVKRFVLTSSSAAAVTAKAEVRVELDGGSWNDEAVRRAWEEPYEMMATYSASKVEGEKAAWGFVSENPGKFVLNTVLPNVCWGEVLDKSQYGASSVGLISSIWGGNIEWMRPYAPQHHVDVGDVAKLHVAALLDPSVQGERLFAFGEPFNWNKVLATLRRLRPDHKFIEDVPENGEDLSTVPQRGVDLLKTWGQNGWTSMEESLRRQTKDME